MSLEVCNNNIYLRTRQNSSGLAGFFLEDQFNDKTDHFSYTKNDTCGIEYCKIKVRN